MMDQALVMLAKATATGDQVALAALRDYLADHYNTGQLAEAVVHVVGDEHGEPMMCFRSREQALTAQDALVRRGWRSSQVKEIPLNYGETIQSRGLSAWRIILGRHSSGHLEVDDVTECAAWWPENTVVESDGDLTTMVWTATRDEAKKSARHLFAKHTIRRTI